MIPRSPAADQARLASVDDLLTIAARCDACLDGVGPHDPAVLCRARALGEIERRARAYDEAVVTNLAADHAVNDVLREIARADRITAWMRRNGRIFSAVTVNAYISSFTGRYASTDSPRPLSTERF